MYIFKIPGPHTMMENFRTFEKVCPPLIQRVFNIITILELLLKHIFPQKTVDFVALQITKSGHKNNIFHTHNFIKQMRA